MLTDARLRARAMAGMERARSELAWERAAQMTLELYERVLAAKRQARSARTS
jgi:glycosyltransferase involved in cell wall biosynthesis